MKQDDYRNMCDEIKLSEEQKDKIWVAARAKVQTKKENRQKMGRFAKIAMAAAAIIVFFMVTAMPGIIRNKNTNQPAAQVEKSTEEDNSQTVQVNQEMKYYLLLCFQVVSLKGQMERMVAQIKKQVRMQMQLFWQGWMRAKEKFNLFQFHVA